MGGVSDLVGAGALKTRRGGQHEHDFGLCVQANALEVDTPPGRRWQCGLAPAGFLWGRVGNQLRGGHPGKSLAEGPDGLRPANQRGAFALVRIEQSVDFYGSLRAGPNSDGHSGLGL